MLDQIITVTMPSLTKDQTEYVEKLRKALEEPVQFSIQTPKGIKSAWVVLYDGSRKDVEVDENGVARWPVLWDAETFYFEMEEDNG